MLVSCLSYVPVYIIKNIKDPDIKISESLKMHTKLLYGASEGFLFCFQQPAGESPGADFIQNLQHKLILTFSKGNWNKSTIRLSETPMLINVLTVQPDFYDVVISDAQDTGPFLGRLYLCPGVGKRIILLAVMLQKVYTVTV